MRLDGDHTPEEFEKARRMEDVGSEQIRVELHSESPRVDAADVTWEAAGWPTISTMVVYDNTEYGRWKRLWHRIRRRSPIIAVIDLDD